MQLHTRTSTCESIHRTPSSPHDFTGSFELGSTSGNRQRYQIKYCAVQTLLKVTNTNVCKKLHASEPTKETGSTQTAAAGVNSKKEKCHARNRSTRTDLSFSFFSLNEKKTCWNSN